MPYVEITYPRFKAFTDLGLLAAGYKVYTKNAGLTSDAVTYSERTLTTENTNPIILDEAGECLIFVDQAVKLIFTTPTGDESSPIWTMDYIGEQSNDIIAIVSATPGTTYNNYAGCTTPAFTSMPQDGYTLVFIPDVDSVATTPATTFTGTGKNDCYISGPYTGTTSGSVFTVTIDGTGTPDTFKWRKDGGTWTTGVEITAGVSQNLIEGMSLRFSEGTGHTLNDTWTVQVVTPARLNFCGLSNLLFYKNVAGTLEALAAGDLKAGIPILATLGDSQSLWIVTGSSISSSSLSGSFGTRSRKEETDDYTLLTDDKGNLIDFANTTSKILYLDAANGYNGQFFYVRAGGTGKVTIQAYSGEVIYSPFNPSGSNTYILNGGRGEVVQLQCNGVSWEILTTAIKPEAIQGQSKNLVVTVTGGNTLTVAADEVILKTALGNVHTVNSVSLSLNITTSGANGLDTGSEAANTWYAVYVIWNGSTTAGLLSTSATSPTLPTGYLFYARIGWVRNSASSSFIGSIQKGGSFQYTVGPAKIAEGYTGSPGSYDWVAASVSSAVPSTAKKISLILAAALGDNYYAFAAPNASYSITSVSYPAPLAVSAQTSVYAAASAIFILESSNVYYSSGGGSALFVLGWEE